MTITLHAAAAVARIDTLGAQWRTWSISDTDLLWRGDDASWPDSAPILFPVVGWTRDGVVRVDGKTYLLGLHGFARRRHFAIVEQSETSVRLADASDAETKALYPFDYRLDIEFRLEAISLSCAATVTNMGVSPMPYAFGLHPGFCWPDGAGAILFDVDERPEIPVITKAGLFSSRTRAVPLEGRRLPLSHDLLSHEALCFLDVCSRGLTFERDDGTRLRVDMDDFPHIALWSLPSASYLCVESWTGYGDPEGFDGDLSTKPSMRLLPPGRSARHACRYALLERG